MKLTVPVLGAGYQPNNSVWSSLDGGGPKSRDSRSDRRKPAGGHGSRDALIRKIELRRAVDRSADLANALSDCRAGIKRLRDRLNEMDSERSSSASQLRTLEEERTTRTFARKAQVGHKIV